MVAEWLKKVGRGALAVSTFGQSEVARAVINKAQEGQKNIDRERYLMTRTKDNSFTQSLRDAGVLPPFVNPNAPPKLVQPTPKTTTAPAVKQTKATYAGPNKAAAYLQGIDASLGIKAPVDTRAAVRTATMGELDKSAHEQDIAQAHRVARQGAGGSALELSLQNRTGQQLAGNRAQAEAGIQQDFANSQDEYNRQRRAAAISAGMDMTQFSEGEARTANEMASRNADRTLNQGNLQDALALERSRQDFEQNQLFPYQVDQANQLANLQALEAKRANRLGWLMAGIDSAGKVGGAVAGGV